MFPARNSRFKFRLPKKFASATNNLLVSVIIIKVSAFYTFVFDATVQRFKVFINNPN